MGKNKRWRRHTIPFLDLTSWTINLKRGDSGEDWVAEIIPTSQGWPPPCGWKIVESNTKAHL